MGQRRCCVLECKSVSHLPEFSDVKFHAFPTNQIVRNIWMKNCHIEQNRSIAKSNVVCSRHFLESDYQIPKNGRRLLNSNAVPTVFSWGDEKTFSDHLAEAQQTSPVQEAVTKDSADNTPVDTTPVVKTTKKMMSRSQANSAAEKQRSASAEEKTPTDANAKTTKARKSLDSATTPEKPDAKDGAMKSPSKKFEIAAQFAPGVKVEVQDLSGNWHNASVVEVDQGEQEVFISFEKNVKAKGPTAFKLNDEWIAMDSSRLRLPVRQQFKEGDRCLARWTDSRKFKATVLRPLDDNLYEVLFDDGFVKHVKGKHISKLKTPAGEKASPLPHSPLTPTASASTSASPSPLPISPVVTPINKKPFKINPIPKFDLSEFNLPEIPEGEWCCPWINDTPIGDEGFLMNADGTRRPTVLVQDKRLPGGWTKHLYQRSSTSGKWDVVLVGPNNKRFRSKSDVKVYLEEIGQSYNPDIYDFSIHKRRAKDVGVYVHTQDYVPPPIPKPASASDFKLDSSLDTTLQEFKQEPFTGFAPNESTSSILSKITQEIKAESGALTPVKIESPLPTVGSLQDDFIYVGALKVQMVNNLFQCPKEGCNKSFRKENHLQIHVKHYHRELSQQLGACPNMTELAYFRTMGSTIDESSPKNQIPNVQYFEKTFQSEIRTIRKSLSPTRIKTETKPDDPTTAPLAPVLEEQTHENLKRKLNTNQTTPEVKEKRKPSATDKVASPELIAKLNVISESVVQDDQAIVPLTSLKKTELLAGDSKIATQKVVIPRFKIGHTNKIKGNKISRRKGKTIKKKFKRLGKGFKRKAFSVGNRLPLLQDAVGMSDIHHLPGNTGYAPIANQSSRPNRLKFLQYSSIGSNFDSPPIEQRSSSHYINENGEFIKIVRMRQEEIINCLCSYGEEDGLMIQCELCLCWQHGGCNGIEKESEVPEKYVCYICRNPERARESMKYIHDQEWLYEGKLYHANYHAPSRKAPQRFDILKQSHTLTGNLLELKRSLHSLNVKINIAANKDHPKLYLWSRKWEQSPPRSVEIVQDLPKKIEPKLEIEEIPTTITDSTLITETKTEAVESNAENSEQNDGGFDSNVTKEQIDQTMPPTIDSIDSLKSEPITNDSSAETEPKIETKDISIAQQPLKQIISSPKKVVKLTPNIPEPEAAIDPVECQHRLLEHIQKEQNTILSRMQTIDAQIMALESMDDHPDTNTKADFSKTSQTIRLLLNDLAKMQKLTAINEHSISYNPVESAHFL